MRFILIIIFFFATNTTLSQVPTVVPLELKAQYNGQFDYVIIGNSHNELDNWQSPSPPCQMLNQSSANLNLNTNQNIVAAYLYWSGIGDGTFNPIVQFNGNNIEADTINIVDPEQLGLNLYFGSFKDVTNIVLQELNNNYFFENLNLNPLISNYCSSAVYHSGWSLLVIYEDDTLPIQQVNVYDGFASVYGNPNTPSSEATINITNLNIIDTQNARLGYLAWNGSPNLFFNESISLNGNLLSDPLNPVNNPFNGTNTYTGATDLWNMDLDVFDISNFVNVGDTQASLTFTSTANRFIQNVVTVIRSELPDAQVELLAFPGTGDCDVRDFTIETQVSNLESSDILPANTPISFFVLDSNGDEVFLETFFTQNPIPIDGTETQFLDITIPANIPNNTTLIVKVNTLADGSNPANENNILNNNFEQELNLLSSPEPIAVQDISQCANLTEVNFDLDNALAETPNPEDSISYHLSLNDAENDVNPINTPNNYNPDNLFETIYIRRFNGSCFSTSQFNIETLIPPQITEPAIFAQCDFSEEQNGFDTFDLNAVIPDITGGNPNYEVNFFLTQAEAEDLNITNGLSSPYTNENAFSQILFVRVTDLNNNCVSFTELELQVDLLPVIAESSSIPVIESCDEDENGEEVFDLTTNNSTILNGLNPTEHQIQFYTSQTDAENDVNDIDSPSVFPSTGQTIFVRVTENETGCFSITTFDVIVNPIPPLQAVPTNAVCDTNNDGIAEFFLPLAEESILTDTNGFSFEYFETLTDAQNNTNPIPNPNNFQNTQTPVQTIYVLATDDVTGCQNIQSITIEVVPVDFIPFDLTDLEKCEASLDGINVEMDLTEQEPFIFGNTDPGDYSISYHLSQSEAASGQNPIPNPETFLSISNPQEIWVRLVNTASNCVEIGSFNYEILLAPVITPPENIPPIEQCADDDNDTVQTWDLNSTIPSFYDTPELADISFYLTQSDAENAVNALPENFQNTENPQTIFVRAEANNSGCVSFTSFDLLVNTLNESLLPTSLELCDNNNDGFVEDFNFQNIIDDYADNFPEISISFHTSFSDASTQSNSLSSPYQNEVENEQTIYVYVLDNSTNCGQIFELLLRSVPIPELNNPDELRVCDSDEDGIANFDLTLIEEETLGDLEQDNLLISYHTSLSDAESGLNAISDPGNFENTGLPQTIWIRVTDSSNLNNCFGITSFELGIDFLPVANQPEDLFLCDADNDGIETFDVSLQNETVLNGLSETENTISYHKTLSDAENNLNPIEENYVNENNPQSIYVRLENNNAPECFTTTVFDIEVLETPVLDIEDQLVLCQDEPLIISIDDSYDEYLWSNGETSSTITVTEPGNYQVTALINHPALSCENSKSFEVILSEEATINDITTVDWTQSNNSITILVEGNGDYDFSIDGINYQDSNVFNNLTDYEYLVHIRDKNGCGETLRHVYLLDYPQFFTPNGDGINDRWQIINSRQEIFTKIYIFDRYGKLVADINPAGSGWDGTTNGKAMPSSDYWFRVEREDGRVFTGHFTLKR